MRIARSSSLIVLLAALAAIEGSPADPGTLSLPRATEIVSAPGGPAIAILMAGSTVQVLESRDGWSRVAVEGWIESPASGSRPAPASSGPETQAPSARPEPAAPPDASPAAPSTAHSAPAPSAGSGSISGVVAIADASGAASDPGRVMVRLLNLTPELSQQVRALRADCTARREEHLAEAARLKDEASRAMRSIENTTRAFEESDEFKAKRREVLNQLRALDDDCRSREEEMIDRNALRRTITDSGGRYALEEVPPGRYTLQASLQTATQRHQWLVDVSVEPGRRSEVDLSSSNRSSVDLLAPSR